MAIDTSTVEGWIISRAWRVSGDTSEANRRNPEPTMWLYLKDAVEDVANDITDFLPNEILEDADFTITPEPGRSIKILLFLRFMDILLNTELALGRADGIGVKFKSGMDSIESGDAAKMLKEASAVASKAYRDALNRYRLNSLTPLYDTLYDFGADNVEVN